MNHIRKQSKIAHRRMTMTRFLQFLPWTLLAGLVVSAIGLVIPKLIHMEVDATIWTASWIGTTCVVAMIAAICLTLVGRPTVVDAAAEVDRRFKMRERISSAMMLTDEDKHSELGKALVADAQKQAEGVDIADKFSWGLNRKLCLPLIPALLAIAMCYLPNRAAAEPEITKNSLKLTRVKKSTDALLQKIKASRKKAEQAGLTDAVDTFKKLEGELAKMRKNKNMDTKEAFAKLNDIKQQMAERRKELGDANEMRKNLQSLKKMEPGPADKLADALKNGDFTKAEEAIENLMEKMQSGDMTDKEMQQLQKQLEQLEKSLSKAAEAHEAAKDSLKQQIQQAEQAGDTQKAAELQRKLEKAQSADASIEQMQELAEMLSEASESMQEGDMQAAAEALDALSEQLGEMNASDAQLQELDELMDSLDSSKEGMMGQMPGMGQGQQSGEGNGDGMGEGQGQGRRAEEEDDVDFYDARERARMRRGETVLGGNVGGANRKGQTQFEVQEAVLTSMSEEPEALDDSPLPKLKREHTREYFNSIRQGK